MCSVFVCFFLNLVRGCRPGKTVHMTEAEVRGLCLKSREIFLSQPILLELEAPLKICGKIITIFIFPCLSIAFRKQSGPCICVNVWYKSGCSRYNGQIFDNNKKAGKGSGHNEHHEKVKHKTSSRKGHIMWGKTPKWLADFSCLLLDFDSVSYWNICRIYSDFADKKSLMFIDKIVDRMDTYLPTSHLQSMKTPLKLNTSTWLFWLINPLSRLIKMNFIDMRIFFNTAYSVSENNWLFSDCTCLSEIQI
jgi:hypothetical protein